jgi:hypothetical protein
MKIHYWRERCAERRSHACELLFQLQPASPLQRCRDMPAKNVEEDVLELKTPALAGVCSLALGAGALTATAAEKPIPYVPLKRLARPILLHDHFPCLRASRLPRPTRVF